VRSVTLDSNIYVSAFHFGGKPMTVLQAGLEGEIDIAVSRAIIDETLRVLREKFAWPDSDLRDAEAAILAAAYLVSPTETLDVVKADPTDNRILECAVASDSETLVTGDAHLLSLGSFRGIEIMRVGEFLQRRSGGSL
jgi:putative PIN family toxin of toxin-antitoxin system